MYAVITAAGKQYQVAPGQELLLNHLTTTDKKVVFAEVLLLVDDKATKIGQPTLTGVSVEAEILGETKGPKIRVATYKAKSRYRKVKGHRQSLTRVKITRIVTREKK